MSWFMKIGPERRSSMYKSSAPAVRGARGLWPSCRPCDARRACGGSLQVLAGKVGIDANELAERVGLDRLGSDDDGGGGGGGGVHGGAPLRDG